MRIILHTPIPSELASFLSCSAPSPPIPVFYRARRTSTDGSLLYAFSYTPVSHTASISASRSFSRSPSAPPSRTRSAQPPVPPPVPTPSSAGVLVGIIVGAVCAACAMVGIAAVCLMRRRRTWRLEHPPSTRRSTRPPHPPGQAFDGSDEGEGGGYAPLLADVYGAAAGDGGRGVATSAMPVAGPLRRGGRALRTGTAVRSTAAISSRRSSAMVYATSSYVPPPWSPTAITAVQPWAAMQPHAGIYHYARPGNASVASGFSDTGSSYQSQQSARIRPAVAAAGRGRPPATKDDGDDDDPGLYSAGIYDAAAAAAPSLSRQQEQMATPTAPPAYYMEPTPLVPDTTAAASLAPVAYVDARSSGSSQRDEQRRPLLPIAAGVTTAPGVGSSVGGSGNSSTSGGNGGRRGRRR